MSDKERVAFFEGIRVGLKYGNILQFSATDNYDEIHQAIKKFLEETE